MISVIIPIYNVESYIGQCLDSIINQDFTDLEVLLIDDRGSDNSITIAEQVINDYSGPIDFRIITHNINRGLSAARNTGIDNANGDYISFIDSDDYIANNYFSLLFDEIQKDTSTAIAVCCFFSDIDGKISPALYTYDSLVKYDAKTYAERMLLLKAPHNAWGKLYKKTIFKDLRFREGKNYEDILFAYDFWKRFKDDLLNILIIPDRLYYYRQRPGSICHNTETPFFLDEIEGMESIINDLKQIEEGDVYNNLQAKYIRRLFELTMHLKNQKDRFHHLLPWVISKLKNTSFCVVYRTLSIKQFLIYITLCTWPNLYLQFNRS